MSHILLKLVVLSTCFCLCASTAFAVDLSDLAAQKENTSQLLFLTLDEYTKACAYYDETVQARIQAQEDLERTNERVTTLSGALAQRASSMYRQGPYGVIDILLGVTSFKEFTATWAMLATINEQHASQIEEMQTLKSKQKDLVGLLSEKEEEAAEIMGDIENQTAQLNNQITQLESSIEEQRLKDQQVVARANEEALKIAQSIVQDRPTPSAPEPVFYGDGAWDEVILATLSKFGLGTNWLPIIRNIIWRESTNNPSASNGIYVGLCQFSPQWDPPRGWSGSGDWRYDGTASIERMVQYIADTGGLGNHWAETNY